MPSIRISRKHKKTLKEARTAVDRIAKAIAKKFDIEYVWDDNTLNFERAGVTGHIALEKGKVEVLAELSFLLGAIKSAIEREIVRHLDSELGS